MIHRTRKYLAGPGLGPLLVKSVVGSAGLRIAGMFFGFLIGVQLARGLGVEGYGIYGLAMSIIALLTVPTEFGLPQLLTREIAAAQSRKDWGSFLGILKWSSTTVCLISVAIAIAITVGIVATGRDLGSPLAMTLLAGFIMVPFVALGNLFSAALRGLQHIVKGQIPDTLIRPALHSLLLFILPMIAIPLSPALAMGAGALSAAIALGVAGALILKHLPSEIHAVHPRTQPAAWWASALPMALTEGMRVLQGHMAILLLGVLATVSAVGSFRVASSVSLVIAVPITLLNVVGAPIIARLHAEGDKARSQRLLSWIALGMTSCTLFLTLPFIVVGEPLLSHVFGAEFGDANSALLVLCGGSVFSGFYGANAVLLNMTNHQARVTRASAVSLLLLMTIAPPLILLQGVIGAAIAAALSMVIWNFLMWRDARRLLALDTSFLPLFDGLKHNA